MVMPKKKKVVAFADPLARRLSFKDAVRENEIASSNYTHHSRRPNGSVQTSVRNGHSVRPQQEVTNYYDSSTQETVSETPNVFPILIYVILAFIATFFLLGEAIKVSFTQYDLRSVITSLCWSLLLGLLCTIISWMITYSDSLEPGSNPPSPMSPKKVRDRSGHTFHSSYVICLANGVVTFAVCFWYLNS